MDFAGEGESYFMIKSSTQMKNETNKKEQSMNDRTHVSLHFLRAYFLWGHELFSRAK
jgi:hypothetical protein